MFTTLTIFIAWFAFGYSVADLVITASKNNSAGKYND
jgi:hypothetical protein